ncbi:hypothetical protein C7W93_05650 [Glaciimonas sp. PCH181]|nr:hypothetical protein C7W93_05650 [Glaciimonas sp. PCH181]
MSGWGDPNASAVVDLPRTKGGGAGASRRSAVGLVGVAPCFVSNHGHAALILDASGRLFVPGLRAAIALQGIGWSAHPRRALLGTPRMQPNRLRLIGTS